MMFYSMNALRLSMMSTFYFYAQELGIRQVEDTHDRYDYSECINHAPCHAHERLAYISQFYRIDSRRDTEPR